MKDTPFCCVLHRFLKTFFFQLAFRMVSKKSYNVISVVVLDCVVGDPIYTVHDLVLGDLLVTTSVLSVDVSTLCDHASDYTDVIELRLALLTFQEFEYHLLNYIGKSSLCTI